MTTWEVWAGRIVGAILVVLAVGSVAMMSAHVRRQSAIVSCQADYNEAFRSALGVQQQAGRIEREAQRTLLSSPAATTPEARRAALQTYLDSLDEADQLRSDHPLPTKPCG